MRRAQLVLVLFLGACAEGRTPPATTDMAEITTNLTFEFGTDFATEGFCVDPKTPANQHPSCSASNGVQLPLVWPPIEVTLAKFAIDVHEVTNLQYEYCVAAGGCSEPRAGNAVSEDQQVYYEVARFADHPVVNITWEQAEAYCAFVDKRLPTEAEWERVAKGPSGRRFPTDELTDAIDDCVQAGFNGQYCRGDQRMDAFDDPLVTAVDYVEEEAGGKKIYMLFGNAAEWVGTNYREDVQCADDPPCQREDQCPSGDAQCITDAKSCQACGADCFYLCEGEPKKTILCNAYTAASQPLTGQQLQTASTGVTKVYRGGHVSIAGAANSYALCQFRSSRSNAKPEPSWSPTASQPWLGFRCAKSL